MRATIVGAGIAGLALAKGLRNLLARFSFEEAFAHFDSQRRPRTERMVRDSRRFGRIAQLSNPLAVTLRNALVRSLPASVNEHWINSILDVRFESIHRNRLSSS